MVGLKEEGDIEIIALAYKILKKIFFSINNTFQVEEEYYNTTCWKSNVKERGEGRVHCVLPRWDQILQEQLQNSVSIPKSSITKLI